MLNESLYGIMSHICNAFCYCKLFDVSYSNKVILNLKSYFDQECLLGTRSTQVRILSTRDAGAT